MHISTAKFLPYLLEQKYNRFILISNNPNVNNQKIEEIRPQENDLIVQFNKAIHFDLFSNFKCNKMFIFNLARHGFHFGFNKNGVPLRDYGCGEWKSLLYVFAFRLTNEEGSFVKALPEHVHSAVYAPSAAGVKMELAPGKLPSIGFKTIMLFNRINEIREENLLERKPILCVGFNAAEVIYHSWVSDIHDFYHEHRVARALPSVTFV